MTGHGEGELEGGVGEVAATRPEAAAIIQGAADTYAVAAPYPARLITSTVTAALGEERAGELRARGADMDWGQALDYTLTQITQDLGELNAGAQP